MWGLWLAEALAGEARVAVGVVCGGCTGSWTAIRLKEHDPALGALAVRVAALAPAGLVPVGRAERG